MKYWPSDYAAIVGNSKILCVLSHAGLPIRLFWPNIDFGQHIDRFRVALTLDDDRDPLWIDGPRWSHSQSYLAGTNILQTLSEHRRAKIAVTSCAFAHPDEDLLVVRYKIDNRSRHPRGMRFNLYEVIRINESEFDTAALFDEGANCLLFYLRDIVVAASASRTADRYQCGVLGESSSGIEGIEKGILSGNRIQHKSPDAAVSWDLGILGPSETGAIDLFVILSETIDSALARSRALAACDWGVVQSGAEAFWRGWSGAQLLEAASSVESSRAKRRAASTGSPAQAEQTDAADANQRMVGALRKAGGDKAVDIYVRSVLSLKLLSDRETGALIAAPEFDRERRFCGGYGYIWPRDGAFIAYALDVAGKHKEAEAYFDYGRRIQEPSGVWLHRYYSTGQLAPSWGLIQIDETGAMIWAMAEHYALTSDMSFLRRSWDSIERAANYLTNAIDPHTGLPLPSFDLWEEEFSESVYSAAATAGGLAAAAKCAVLLGKTAEAGAWEELATQISKSILERLWDPKENLFLRSVKKRVSEAAFAKGHRRHRDNYYIEQIEGELYPNFIQAKDDRAESSVLGLVFPFRVFAPTDRSMQKAVSTLARRLWSKKAGGIMRYEGDHYVGGNPWILTTLWLAIYHVEAGDRKRAASLIRWAADHATSLDLLTEQVDKKTGEPVWAVPLGWSHAMFIIAAHKLAEM
jgi:glucoamylase